VGSAVGLDQRFTFISHGVGWKRGAILRRSEERKTRKKAEKRAVLRGADCGLRLVGWWVRRALASPVVVLSRRWSVPRSTRRREAGAGAAEVVKGAGVEAWRAAVYATRETQYVRRWSADPPCRRKSPRLSSAPPAA